MVELVCAHLERVAREFFTKFGGFGSTLLHHSYLCCFPLFRDCLMYSCIHSVFSLLFIGRVNPSYAEARDELLYGCIVLM